jgi:hypothetical protein
MPRLPLLVAAAICLLGAQARLALADTWDLNLGRLCQVQTQSGARYDCGGGYTGDDPIAGPVIPDNAAFRALMSELGAVFAPNLLAPSDTRGYSGFNLSAEFAWTKVNPHGTAKDPHPAMDYGSLPQGHYYWRAAQSVSNSVYADGNVRTPAAIARIGRELPPSFAPTIAVMARKGLWIPVPSFELGLGVKHLVGSTMWAPTVTAKVALHEGFHGWPVPSLAVRGSGSRVMGTPGFNMSIAGLDFSMSKHIGLASTFNISPYLGYQLLWIIADSEVLDATPAVDAMGQTAVAVGNDPLQMNQCRASGDCRGFFTFANQSNITRHRFFVGLKANFYVASLLLEYTFFASGAKSDQIATDAGLPLTIPDEAGAQHSISFALALDY